eukprot:scaffold34577_cov30-Tisochrysis_lutea.AAC.4
MKWGGGGERERGCEEDRIYKGTRVVGESVRFYSSLLLFLIEHLSRRKSRETRKECFNLTYSRAALKGLPRSLLGAPDIPSLPSPLRKWWEPTGVDYAPLVLPHSRRLDRGDLGHDLTMVLGGQAPARGGHRPLRPPPRLLDRVEALPLRPTSPSRRGKATAAALPGQVRGGAGTGDGASDA